MTTYTDRQKALFTALQDAIFETLGVSDRPTDEQAASIIGWLESTTDMYDKRYRGESTSPVAGFSEATQGEREFHEAVVSLVRDMMNAMQNEHFWSDVPELHVRVNALLTAPLPRAVASQPGAPAEPNSPEAHGLPSYPTGNVVGPCVCGSWPGGECLKCAVIPAPSTAAHAGATFEWPALPDLPTQFACHGFDPMFSAHQMQGYANAYGEIVRALLAAAKPVSVDAGGMTLYARPESIDYVRENEQKFVAVRGIRDEEHTVPLTVDGAEALNLLRELAPYMDSLICYASTCAEYKPNDIVRRVNALLTPPTESTGSTGEPTL
jgi:hypothetical protein